MSKRTLTILGVLFTLSLSMLACNFTGSAISPTQDPFVFNTAVAQTVEAQLTKSAFEKILGQLTQTPGSTDSGQTAASATPTPTPTQTSTNTRVPPTPTRTPTRTPVPIPCYQALFVKDVTIADGSLMQANQSFSKTWRLQNSGSCTWTTDFNLVYVDGTQMNAPDEQSMPATIRPGDTVDLTVNLKAPGSSGTYRANFKLQGATGVIFGLGPNADKSFFVEISVQNTLGSWNSNHPRDFAYNYCQAVWTSSKGALPCPSTANDLTNGSITRTSAPVFEGGYTDNEPTLITLPSSGSNGYITGHYPPLKIRDGDHFKTMVGCLNKSPKCDITFELLIANKGETALTKLGSWHEVYDGDWTHINVDLSDYANETMEIYLRVKNNGSSVDDRGFWLAPLVYK